MLDLMGKLMVLHLQIHLEFCNGGLVKRIDPRSFHSSYPKPLHTEPPIHHNLQKSVDTLNKALISSTRSHHIISIQNKSQIKILLKRHKKCPKKKKKNQTAQKIHF